MTGASGFIGSFIVERALELGFEVWAGVRASSSRRWLTDARIRFIDLDLSDEGRLQRSLETFKAEGGAWDYVVHAAGATKAKNRDGFMAVNRDGTVRLVTALTQMQMVPKKLVFLSSLSVLGAIHETDYAPLTSLDTPHPNTAYGQSKLAAETFLRQQGDVPCIVLRPTGVYGPREHDYFLMAKSICQHVDFAVGYKRQDITFIYVKDLVEAVFQALEHGVPGQNYLLSDGKVYDSRDFSNLLQKYLGVKRVLHLHSDRQTEALSIPLMQIGRYVMKHEDEMTPEEIAVIDAVVKYDGMAERYDPTHSNSIKNHSRNKATKQDWMRFFGLWAQKLKEDPLTYVEATMNFVFGYTDPVYIRDETLGMYISDNNKAGRAFATRLLPEKFEAMALSYVRFWRRVFPLRIFMAAASYYWCYLILLGAVLRKKKSRKHVLIFVFPLLVFAICCASPICGSIRYSMPALTALPLFICVTLERYSRPRSADSFSGAVQK